MTPGEWDAHERTLCERCRYDRGGRGACKIKQAMHANPSDMWAANLFRRLGRCSQWAERPEASNKGKSKSKSRNKNERGRG